jgi:hypothetical protein
MRLNVAIPYRSTLATSVGSLHPSPNNVPVGVGGSPLRSAAIREFVSSKVTQRAYLGLDFVTVAVPNVITIPSAIAVPNPMHSYRASEINQPNVARAEIGDPPALPKSSRRIRIPGLSKLPRLIISPLTRKPPRVQGTSLPFAETPTHLPNPTSRPTSGKVSNSSFVPLRLSLPRAFPLDGIVDVENAFERPRPAPRII